MAVNVIGSGSVFGFIIGHFVGVRIGALVVVPGKKWEKLFKFLSICDIFMISKANQPQLPFYNP